MMRQEFIKPVFVWTGLEIYVDGVSGKYGIFKAVISYFKNRYSIGSTGQHAI